MTELTTDSLIQDIRKAIHNSREGGLPFRTFMELCLYHPEYGYYRSARPKIGKDGDFYTPANVGGITAELIARYYAKRAGNLPGDWIIAEFGGGTGRMARILLDTLKAEHPAIYERTTYRVEESSPYHMKLQQEELSGHRAKVVFAGESAGRAMDRGHENRFVLAQELLDAFPVHRIRQRDGGPSELYVVWDEANLCFAEIERPGIPPEVAAYLERNEVRLLPGQTAEINLLADQWIAERLSEINRGFVLVIDYGDRADEIYAPHRFPGTLMCYHRHQASDDPYKQPGQQDITAHVNFSSCLRTAAEAGAEETALWKHRDFLLEQGVLELLADHAGYDPFSPVAKRNRAIRQLLVGDRMGDLFKVMLLGKGM